GAVALYREYIEKYSTVENAVPSGTLALNIALIYEKGKDWAKAEQAFDEFLRNHPKASAGERFFARYRRALALTELGRRGDAMKEFETVSKDFEKLAESDRRRIDYIDAYAHAHFQMMESNWQRYQAVKFDNVRTLRRSLDAKLKMTPTLEQDYIRILEI